MKIKMDLLKVLRGIISIIVRVQRKNQQKEAILSQIMVILIIAIHQIIVMILTMAIQMNQTQNIHILDVYNTYFSKPIIKF